MMVRSGRGHAITAAAVQGHLGLERKAPVPALRVEGGLDFGESS